MAKQPPKKPTKPKRLGKAGQHLGKAGKDVVMEGRDGVDHEAIAASNKAVGSDVAILQESVAKFPTFLDLKAKVHEGLIVSNFNVYEWAQNQFFRMQKLAEAMDIIEEVSFTREALIRLTPVQRIKLWKTFEQAMTTRVELMQAINNKAQEFSLTQRFLEGYERERDAIDGTPMELPYSPEFRAMGREEYQKRVLGITHEPEQPEL